MSNEKNLVKKIRAFYEEKSESNIDKLKELDKRVKRPAKILAYVIGSIGTLVLGTGMCLCMPDVIEGCMMIGIPVGIVGIVIISVNYLIYKAYLDARRRKASEEILKLSDEILGND